MTLFTLALFIVFPASGGAAEQLRQVFQRRVLVSVALLGESAAFELNHVIVDGSCPVFTGCHLDEADDVLPDVVPLAACDLAETIHLPCAIGHNVDDFR